jgi:hypothetical protein
VGTAISRRTWDLAAKPPLVVRALCCSVSSKLAPTEFLVVPIFVVILSV